MTKEYNHKGPAGRCENCQATMRWQGETLEGAKLRRKEGWCMGCHRKCFGTRSRPLKPPEPGPDKPPFDPERDRAWMDQYVANRHARKVPVNGYPVEGEQQPSRYYDRWERP